MKLIIDDNITIFLGKIYLKNIDINDQIKIEKQIMNLIKKVKKRYDININGYYNAYVYIDKNYGLALKLVKEEFEYLEYLNNLELNVQINEDEFLYKVYDIFNINEVLLPKFEIYRNKDDIYLKAKDKLSDIELGFILENSDIIFGLDAQNIKNKAQIIKVR